MIWRVGPFSEDKEQAEKYYDELLSECNGSESCYTKGNRWSIIYKFNGLLLAIIAVNGILQAIGAF